MYSVSKHTEFTIFLGGLKFESSTSMVFPKSWVRICVSVDSAIRMVVNGNLLGERRLGEVGQTWPQNLSLVLGAGYLREFSGFTTEVNMFSSSHSFERLVDETTPGRDWALHSGARMVEVEASEGPCRRESSLHLYPMRAAH